jgi:GAF domain-containing protein
VIKNRQPTIVDSTREDPRWLQRAWEDDDRSALGVPLMVSERVVGVLTLVRPEPQQFAESDLELVAGHAAVGV